MTGTTRRRFDPEFRAGAVRIVKETGKPVAHIARDLGINEYTLYNWVQMDRHATGQVGRDGNGGSRLKGSEQEELARLRREKAELVKQHSEEKAAWEKERAELEDERDVLKRSVVLWVKDSLNR
ncbi:transposase [Nonomuraea sp. K274]|uniref:Transposase n=1 Tax=Nonomuraea cypriaca TaxID=1187855 RepID=A0A931AHS5_9ACTN|nr:transposase [Nonomuraea cypriaca]MBF8193227.1 transposase [Nonomuraea cypriaca]